MQYLLMSYVDEAGWPKLSKAEQEQGVAAYTAYTEALTKAGVLKAANRVRPTSSATTIRMSNGKTQVLDGPYADSKEQLGGYYLIDVPDVAAALSWAARCPAAGHGVVEVRPIWATSAGARNPEMGIVGESDARLGSHTESVGATQRAG